jgi:transcriptional regulator with XRE-family HTH domain
MVEISSTFMMHIEHGTRGASLETVELLANALGVDIPILFLRPPGADDASETVSHRNAFVKYLEDQISLVIRNSFAEHYSDS